MLQGYGMTEATGALTEELEDVCRQGSVGKILAGNIIKVNNDVLLLNNLRNTT